MEELINYLKKQANVHKILAENLEKLDKLASIDNTIAEKQIALNALRNELEARTRDLADVTWKVADQKNKLADEALKAAEMEKDRLATAQFTADAVLKAANDEAKEIISHARTSAWDWEQEVEARKTEVKLLRKEISELQAKHDMLVDKLNLIKSSI